MLTSVARLSCISTAALAVGFAQARHATLSVFTARQAAGVGGIPVLLVTEDASETGLAAAGVGIRVDWEAGTVDTPVDGDTGRVKMWTDMGTHLPAKILFGSKRL